MANIATELELPAEYDDASARLFHLNPPMKIEQLDDNDELTVGFTSYILIWVEEIPVTSIRRRPVTRAAPSNRAGEIYIAPLHGWMDFPGTTDITYVLASLDYRRAAL